MQPLTNTQLVSLINTQFCYATTVSGHGDQAAAVVAADADAACWSRQLDKIMRFITFVRHMHTQMDKMNRQMQLQLADMDEMNRQMQLQLVDVGNWKDKWIQEGAKSDGIKRECLQ
eukprot:scaffold46362_cov19-Tisochrysis_lutea.AAC.1